MKLKLVLFVLCAGLMRAAEPGALVIAHRGASGYLPEHTLPAVAFAHAIGADYIEQDIVLSKDGVPLVLHDIEIDTVTDVAARFPGRKRANGHYYAIDFTLAEIKQLRASERFDPKTGQAVFPQRFPPGRSVFSIPTLEEELELIQGLNLSVNRQVGIYPEIKAPAWHRRQGYDISAIVLEVLARHGYRTKDDPFYLQCFDFEEVRRLRTELKFEGKLVQLIGRYGGGEVEAAGAEETKDNTALLRREQLGEVARYADGIGPSLTHLVNAGPDGKIQINEVVALAHEHQLVVHPYTFRTDALPKFASSTEGLLSLLFQEMKIDGLFADQPDVVVEYLRRRAAPPVIPAKTPGDRDILGRRPVYTDRTVSQVPNDAAVGRRIWAPGLNEGFVPQGLTMANGRLLLVAYRSSEPKPELGLSRVHEVDPATGGMTGQFDLPGEIGHPGGLAYDGTSLYVANFGTLLRIDLARSLATREAVITARRAITREMGPSFLTCRDGVLWFGRFTRKAEDAPRLYGVPVDKIFDGSDKPLQPEAAMHGIPLPTLVQGLVFDDHDRLWVSASLQNEGWLYQLALADGRMVQRHAVAPGIEGLALAATGRIWAAGECGSRRWLDSDTFYPLLFEIDPDRLGK